jgi:Ca2+-binding RTX toxin-like protein
MQTIRVPIDAVGVHEVTSSHFSFNYVFDYERIGSQRWAKFDEIVNQLKPGYLRYPGGTQLETVFDIENPNATNASQIDGSITQVMGMGDFLSYVDASGIKAIIGVPVTQLLTITDRYGSRDFDNSKSVALRGFIREALLSNGGKSISDIELGNEYEGYMTSEEYGRVASRAAQIVQEEIDLLKAAVLIPSVQDPRILVQVWSQSIHGALSFEDLRERNQKVLQEFSAAELDAVDGVVSHYYYREGADLGRITENSLGNLEQSIALSASLLDPWSTASGRALFEMYSEWNTIHTNSAGFGARQASLLVDMFGAFLSAGTDAMSFWSAQYHGTSLANGGGNLMAAGHVFEMLKTNLVGTTKVDYDEHLDDVGIQIFYDSEKLIVVVNSQTSEERDLSLDLGITGVRIVGTERLNVDLGTANGTYKQWTALDPYNDPDAVFNVTVDDNVMVVGSDISLTLNPYEVLIMELRLPVYIDTNASWIGTKPKVVHTGTNGNDAFNGTRFEEVFFGGPGSDTVDYSNAAEAVKLHLGATGQHTGAASGDIFDSIELFIGTRFADTLLGSASSEQLYGGPGNDTLSGNGGSDKLFGGLGDDRFFASQGREAFFGGDGYDIVDYSLEINPIRLRLLQGHLNSGAAVGDTITEVEAIVGTNASDQLIGSRGSERFYGGAGDDTLGGEGGGDSIFGGSGNDTIFAAGQRESLFGGSGQDKINFGQFTAPVYVDFVDQRRNALATKGSFISDFEIVEGSSLGDVFRGTSIADTFFGMGGSDSLFGGGGRDTLIGGLGDDLIDGGEGADKIDGGLGFDTLQFRNSAVTVDLLIPTRNRGDAYGDIIHQMEGLLGSEHSDAFYGDSNGNMLVGNGGADVLSGRLGNDTLFGGSGNDTLFGGEGNDLLNGGLGSDIIDGGAGFDMLQFTGGALTVDLMDQRMNRGAAQGDVIRQVEGLSGSDFHDVMYGDGNSNRFVGNAGSDLLSGRSGNDTLFGGSGNDSLFGGHGNDLLIGGLGSDFIDGGPGFDTLHFNGSSVTVDLENPRANRGDAQGDVIRQVEALSGSTGGDMLYGDSRNNSLRGEGGSDYLSGRSGNDTIFGGDGDDTLSGGRGFDQLYGGSGSDRFVFARGDGFDGIYGFSVTQGDQLLLSSSLFTYRRSGEEILRDYGTLHNGNLTLDFGGQDRITLFGTTSFEYMAGQLFIL